jgi:DNA (cytosine-5)-methyltransferase 1
MRYLSVCSGIEAATAAWHPLGWTPVAFSEIDAFPSAVLAHHYPDVPNLGDMTKYQEWPDESVDLLVGGTPCQSFSVAGLRGGLSDPRGGLMLTYLEIARRYRPRWIVWENVPGVLSSNGGRDFGSFLGALGELGYGFAYRVLDAQWFGVAQRRRRVFVVGYLGDWRRAAAVLFKSESVCRDTPPSRETREETSRDTASSIDELQPYRVANCLTQRMYKGINTTLDEGQTPVIAFHNRQDPDVSGTITHPIGAKDNGLAVAYPVHYRKSRRAQSNTDYETWVEDESANTLNCFDIGDVRATDIVAHPDHYVGSIDYEMNASSMDEPTGPLLKGSPTGGGRPLPAVASSMRVRRLTPVECERLQGFPDNFTSIPWRGKAETPDGHRYRALGNSMAVPCMAWIGNRINQEDKQ